MGGRQRVELVTRAATPTILRIHRLLQRRIDLGTTTSDSSVLHRQVGSCQARKGRKRRAVGPLQCVALPNSARTHMAVHGCGQVIQFAST